MENQHSPSSPFLLFLQVKWYRDTMLLDANENRLMEQYGFRHSMVIRSAAKTDFGNYSCSAENSLGRSRAFIEVSGEQMLWPYDIVRSAPLNGGCSATVKTSYKASSPN